MLNAAVPVYCTAIKGALAAVHLYSHCPNSRKKDHANNYVKAALYQCCFGHNHTARHLILSARLLLLARNECQEGTQIDRLSHTRSLTPELFLSFGPFFLMDVVMLFLLD
ncbi:hypothetical protein M6B38_398155 [Iris pallida]|uniref:Uncharacterized protein n=1 Tax=Iris pallida TaxID=29817 RepID=A0AAX6FW22_IRIPA|nr:hypothetical protein M6B38_398155 [Iris pallida]